MFSYFLYCNVNEKSIEYVYDLLMLMQWTNDAIYPNFVAILMNNDEAYYSCFMNDTTTITLLW